MMDLVGYTSQAELDLAGTLRRWGMLLESHIEPAIDRYRGEVFRLLGDGMLIAFPTAHDALACVLEIQRKLAVQEGESLPFKLRGAIDAGEIVVWKGDLHGTAVVISARLQEFAAPGGVIVSEAIKNLVCDRVSEPFCEIGDLQLKGIERRVRAYSLLERPPDFIARQLPSIAVLPFVEVDSPEGSYFGDGMVEDIVNALAAMPELFVISRTSTHSLRACAEGDLGRIRESLGVRYVLSGTVRRAQHRIVITARLTDTESLRVLWSDRVDGHFDDIFDFQESISRQIVGVIAPHVREAELKRIARKRPENLNAYDCFLRGLDLVYRLKPEQFNGAKAMFARAIELDPNYAVPYAYSALWHAIRIGQGWSEDPEADRNAARYFAEAGVNCNERDAVCQSVRGHVAAIQDKDFKLAIESFKTAIDVSPNSAMAWTRSSPTYSYLGDWKDGRLRAERGLRLAPLDKHLFYTYTVLGLASYTGEEYEEAIEWGRKALVENPYFTANLRFLSASLVAAGRNDEARQVAGQLLQVEPGFRVDKFCANYAYKEPERRKLLAAHLKAAGLPE